MKRSILILIFVGAFAIAAYRSTDMPRIDIESGPLQWRANEQGRLFFRLSVREGSLESGSRISIGLPGSWNLHAFHSYEEGGKTYPYQRYGELTRELASYFEVDAPRSDSKWELEVIEEGLDGHYHRFARKLLLTLVSGSLDIGQDVTIHYGTSSKPIHASFLDETASFPVRVAPEGSEWTAVGSVSVRTLPEEASQLLLTLPSLGQTEKEVELHISARDRFGNATTLPTDLKIRGPAESHGAEVSGHFARVPLTFARSGVFRVEVGNDLLGYALSNPIIVRNELPEANLYWGDLHSHSEISKDGIGSDSFLFARDYSDLDFFASTEHSTGDRSDNGVTDSEWEKIQRAVQLHYQPGRFVTLLAYECSLPYPYGHHNVYFADDTAPIYRNHEVKTLQELWRRLSRHRAFTVPHHTGIVFGESGRGASAVWDEGDHPLRPLLEIYSGHGQSELYDPDSSLSYEQMVFDQRWKEWFPRSAPSTPDKYRKMVSPHSHDGPNYARDAWAAGLHVGTIASSDDHTGRPGQPSKGLTAVWAPRLEREAIFQALRQKRTYGTTGQRIYLDFRMNDAVPGSQIVAREPRIPLLIEVHGTQDIAWIELLRLSANDRAFHPVREWRPEGASFQVKTQETLPEGDTVYYLRLRQEGFVDGRPAMAWSSPIWISRSSTDERQ